jgi:hypothetical protein
MHLSTFNSDAPPGAARVEVSTRLLVVTFALVVMILVTLEVGTRFGFLRISTVETRIASEHGEALRLRHDPARPSVLLVGNSLLLDGVDMEELRRLLPADLRVARFAVEATWFLDWKYGLRRLFAEGARPDFVVLMLGPTNVTATAIRGDYSAYYLFNVSDIPALGRELGLSHTEESSLYLARYSLFWAGRNNIRSFITRKIFADYAESLHSLAASKPRAVSGADAERLSAQKLAQVSETASSYGAQFVFVVPPGFDGAGERDVTEGARKAGVTVVVPVHSGDWPMAWFRDGYHLNSHGTSLFTIQLADQLTRVFNSGRPHVQSGTEARPN